MKLAKNPRINVTFDQEIVTELNKVANLENKSVAAVVRDFTLDSLERREDYHLSKIAEKIDQQGAKRHGHKDVWK